MIQSVFLFAAALLAISLAQHCGVDHIVGEADPSTVTASQDTNRTGYTFVLEDTRYTFDCCGVVSRWNYYGLNAGNITFQAWRNDWSTGNYTMVGKSYYESIASTATYPHATFVVPTDYRISVQIGDYIGFEYAWGNAHFIPYTDGAASGNSRIAYVPSVIVGETYDWTAVPFVTGIGWAIQAITQPSSAPTFLNLPNGTTISDSTQTGTSVFQVTSTDIDLYDIPQLTWTLPVSSSQFQLASSTGELTVSGTLTAGTYHLTVRVADPCGKYTEDTLTVVITTAGQAAASTVDDDFTLPTMIISILVLLLVIPVCVSLFIIMRKINTRVISNTRQSERVDPEKPTGSQKQRP